MHAKFRKGLMLVAAVSSAASWWVGCGGDDAFVQEGSTPDSGAMTPDATAADSGNGPTDGGPKSDAATDAAQQGDTGTGTGTDSGIDGGGLAIQIPASAPYDQWTWIPVAGAVCADGSPTGIGVSPHQGSTTLTVYFEGGGACWNDATCQAVAAIPGTPTASNLTGYGSTQFAASGIASYGIFQRASNPLQNENFIYVPYCTGDIHAGDNVATYNNLTDGGTFNIHHVGYANAGLDLSVVKATFPQITRLVVTGASAGGYGSLFNYERIHQTYPGVRSFLIDDSGPPLGGATAEYTAQESRWHSWENVAADCPGCTPADGGAFENIIPYLTKQDPTFRGSLLETSADNTISAFFSTSPLFGGDEVNTGCVASDGSVGPGPCDFTTRLATVYDGIVSANVASGGQMRAFIEKATFHTYLHAPSTYGLVSPFIASQLGLDGGADGGWTDMTPFPAP